MIGKSPMDQALEELSAKYVDRYTSNKDFRLAVEASYPLPITRSISVDLARLASNKLYRACSKLVLKGYMRKLLESYASNGDDFEATQSVAEKQRKMAEMKKDKKNDDSRNAKNIKQAEKEKKRIMEYVQREMENLNEKKGEEIESGRQKAKNRRWKNSEKTSRTARKRAACS